MKIKIVMINLKEIVIESEENFLAFSRRIGNKKWFRAGDMMINLENVESISKLE
jgi:hypothetical protein